MATKLGRMVTHLNQPLPIVSFYTLVTWSYEITWQTKNIPPLPRCLWPPNLWGVWLTMRAPTHNFTNLWITWSWEMTNMPMTTKLGSCVTYHELIPPIKTHDHIITWSRDVTWQTIYHHISTTAMPVATKLGRVGKYNKELPSINSNNPLIVGGLASSLEILDLLYLYYNKAYDNQTWKVWTRSHVRSRAKLKTLSPLQ